MGKGEALFGSLPTDRVLPTNAPGTRERLQRVALGKPAPTKSTPSLRYRAPYHDNKALAVDPWPFNAVLLASYP
jgi:hypothetical protein